MPAVEYVFALDTLFSPSGFQSSANICSGLSCPALVTSADQGSKLPCLKWSLKLFARLSSLSSKDILNPIDDHGPTKAQFCSFN